MRIRTVLWAFGIALAAGLFVAGPVQAFGGRYATGGHPYHNGYYFIPPSSAYEAVRYRPPFRYGVPSYYFPESYLAPGTTFYPPWGPYFSTPGTGRGYFYAPPEWAGSWYMSAHGASYVYPW